jgi:DNA repair photolyase
MTEIRRHYFKPKSAIRKKDLADFFTISKYGISPYTACQHGCLYCDGRAEKYFVQGEFERDIIIRKNLPQLLEKELPKIREKGFLCIGSGVSDPYQPLEQVEKVTRECAAILSEFDLPVVVMTKSSLVQRDLDMWSKVNSKTRFLLMMSLTFCDDFMRARFEPVASSVQDRLQTLDLFKKAGCATGVLAMPLLPYISETEENMCLLADNVKKVNADFMMPGGLTLRPGIQKDTFMSSIREFHPDLQNPYEQIYSENRASGAPSLDSRNETSYLYKKMSAQSGLPMLIPHAVFKGQVSLYEEVYLLLLQMGIAYSNRGIDTKRLQKATEYYKNWIVELKRPINRSRNRSYKEIDDTLRLSCNNGKIGKILNNEKLGNFVRKVVVEDGDRDDGQTM